MEDVSRQKYAARELCRRRNAARVPLAGLFYKHISGFWTAFLFWLRKVPLCLWTRQSLVARLRDPKKNHS
jgi:hypothetical protein